MNGRQIEIFHAVMRAGTITEAASWLGITQPAVTASLKQIEATIGFNLFHRMGGRLHPTAEARQLYLEAERVQDSLGVFRKLAERLKDDLVSHLRIVTPPAFSHEIIPEVISQFMDGTRDCMIDVTTQHHDQILKDVSYSAGSNTLGFTFGHDNRHGIGAQTVGKAELVAIIPKSSPLAGRRAVSIEELFRHPLVGTFAGEPLGNALERMILKAGVKAGYVIRVHNHNVAASLATKGVGAAIIDSITAAYTSHVSDPDSFSIARIEETAELPVTAVFSYEHPLNDHAMKFISLFRNCLKTVEF